MFDAAEIARLREDAKGDAPYSRWARHTLSLLDDIEQAQKERDGGVLVATRLGADVVKWQTLAFTAAKERNVAEAQRDAAQKDAKDARALAYEECVKVADGLNADKCAHGVYEHGYWDACNEIAAAIRARIEAMLKPRGDQT